MEGERMKGHEATYVRGLYFRLGPFQEHNTLDQINQIRELAAVLFTFVLFF